jgi:hypothetical protein
MNPKNLNTGKSGKNKGGFTLVELAMIVMLSVAISAMGLQLITKQTYVYLKMHQLDSMERTAHNLNNLFLGMTDNWSAKRQVIDGNACIVFSSRDKSHDRLVTIEPATVNRGGTVGTAVQLHAKVYNGSTATDPIADYKITDPLIKSMQVNSDVTTIQVIITDVWNGTANCHASRN